MMEDLRTLENRDLLKVTQGLRKPNERLVFLTLS